MNKLSKTLIALVLGSMALSAQAQVGTKNFAAERMELSEKYRGTLPINIAWYIGAVEGSDFRDLVDQFLPMSNYLSNKVNGLVVVDTFRSDRDSAEKALNSPYDFIYTSVVQGSQLTQAGWKPLLTREERINAVVLALAENKNFNSEKDFGKVKITGPEGGITTQFTQFSLVKLGVLKPGKLAENSMLSTRPIGQTQLLNVLRTRQTDGIIVRDSIAKTIMDANPGQYKVVYQAQSASGHMLLASPKADPAKVERFRAAIAGMEEIAKVAPKDPVFAALDGHNSKITKIFKEVDPEDLKLGAEVFIVEGQKPLK